MIIWLKNKFVVFVIVYYSCMFLLCWAGRCWCTVSGEGFLGPLLLLLLSKPEPTEGGSLRRLWTHRRARRATMLDGMARGSLHH